ncbi:MAG: glycosyltransferase family 39 protein [Candidatus Erginobacter occultus]|nr:glycosyltransferase family 39 protein [Candidatus Erginobacter occultus]
MKRWVLLIFGINLAARLLFLNWHPAVYTDSVDYMTALERVRGTIILPAYPFALKSLNHLTGDLQLAGRLVSIIFAALAVFPLFGLARAVYNRRAALFTVLFCTVSPLIFRWSLRIFPHGMYSFCVLLFFYGIFRSFEVRSPWWLAAGIFSGGVAILTYPTGLVLVPAAAVAVFFYFLVAAGRERSLLPVLGIFLAGWILLGLGFLFLPRLENLTVSAFDFLLGFFPVSLPGPLLLSRLIFLGAGWGLILLWGLYLFPAPGRKAGWWCRRPLALLAIVLSAGPYIFLYIWQHHLAMSTWYQEGMRTSMRSLAGRWETWLDYYLVAYPYVLIYPVAVLAGIGLVLTVIRSFRQPILRGWTVFFIYFFAAVFYTLVVNKWWTPRYLYMLVAASLPLAGYGADFLVSARKRVPRSSGWIIVSLSLLASTVFTGFALYWSRDSFADIRRSADYIRENLGGRTVYSSELRKVGWWAKTPLRGYTQQSRGRVRPGDYVLLVGWHTNLNTELRYLSSRYTLREVNRERVELRPLLADDIVDWAGRRLRRRANDPVCWEERFNLQTLESVIVEVIDPETGRGMDEGKILTPSNFGLWAGGEEHATYFDSGVWEVVPPPEEGTGVVVELAHARAGEEGAFRFVVYADTEGDGLPDRLVGESPLLRSERPDQWSRWEFTAPGGRIFVGSRWPLGAWVFIGAPPWPEGGLGETMFYSRGGVPHSRARRITNLRLSFPGKGEEN